jgi:hypothetical protein
MALVWLTKGTSRMTVVIFQQALPLELGVADNDTSSTIMTSVQVRRDGKRQPHCMPVGNAWPVVNKSPTHKLGDHRSHGRYHDDPYREWFRSRYTFWRPVVRVEAGAGLKNDPASIICRPQLGSVMRDRILSSVRRLVVIRQDSPSGRSKERPEAPDHHFHAAIRTGTAGRSADKGALRPAISVSPRVGWTMRVFRV